MPSVHVVRERLDDRRRGELLFDGALLVFPLSPGLAAFRDRVADLIRERLGAVDPETVHASMAPDELDAAVQDLRATVRRDHKSGELLLTALAGTGLDLDDACWDRVNLRMLPPGAAHAGKGTGWHRDTWGSNIAAQTNWWTPVFPVTEGRTISFAPSLWRRSVANSSAGWTPAAARAQAVPLIPEPEGPLEDLDELPVVIRPGDLLCFSAAQMHRSVPNRTDRTRFSIEVRTVSETDIRAGRGAPNLDADTPDVHYRWFRRVSDGSTLTAPE